MPPWIYTVLGRRWFRGERKETAALISQSRRFIGARMCLLYDGFFSFAVVRQVFLLFILLCYMDDYGNYDGFFLLPSSGS